MLHFTSRAEWQAGLATGEYQPVAMTTDGFVHLSFGHQLARVAGELARGRSDLVLLVVDPSGLEGDVRVEGGFPHLYRPIPVASVSLVVDFPPQPDGSFEIPEEARLAELTLGGFPTAEAALHRVRAVMNGFPGPWWVAGGWAVDAATGAVSRPHLDLDIAVCRSDASELGRHLAGWDLRIPGDRILREWDGRAFPESEHQVCARPGDGYRPQRWQDFALDPGFVEFLVEEVDAEDMWVFRRDPAVRAPLERLGEPGGFLAPEVALLYKAKAAVGDDPVAAAKAQGDFDSGAAHLRPSQRDWLTHALARAHADHPWIAALAS